MCFVCGIEHEPMILAGIAPTNSTVLEQAVQRVWVACRELEGCVWAHINDDQKKYFEFRPENTEIIIKKGDIKVTLLICDGFKDGKLMEIIEIKKRIFETYMSLQETHKLK